MFDLFGMIREKGVVMISKELLSEVLNEDIEHIYDKSDMSENYICYMPKLGCNVDINIYELAHKCKEWALDKKRYVLETRIVREYDLCSDVFYKELSFCRVSLITKPDVLIGLKCEDTEPGAIFETCQWILDNKED